MQQQIQRVALAALLHDVGKFAQRAEAEPEACPAIANLNDFVVGKPPDGLSRHHAAFTWHFIAEHFPGLTRAIDGEGTIARWAAPSS